MLGPHRALCLSLACALAACSGDARHELAPAPPLLTSAPVPSGPSCDRPASHSCTEYPPSRYVPDPGEDMRASCTSTGGTWSDAPCSREGSLGDCPQHYGQVVVFDATLPGDPRASCDGTFFPSPATIAAEAARAEQEAALARASAPVPDPEPAYHLDPPEGFVAYDAPLPPSGRNLVAYRSERGWGRTDAHAVLLVRVEVLPDVPPEELAHGLDVDWRDVERAGVRVVSHRETESAGARGLLWEGLSRTDEGEGQRTLTLQVLDGRLRYTLSCGGASAVTSSWRSACDRALASFRVVHAAPAE